MQPMSFPAIGLRKRSSRRIGTMPLSTILASPLVNRYRFGVRRGGSTPRTRGAGFSGIAVITLAAASPGKMRGRSNDGKQCAATFGRFRRTVNLAICAAAGDNDRRFSNGLTTVEQSETEHRTTALK